MATLDATRAELAFLVMYLNKAETRDKICRAIQYGSKFLSNGEPGVAAQVDKTTSLARKVFRLAKVGKKSRASLSRPSLPAVLFLVLSQLQLSVLSSIASSPSKQRSFLPELIDENWLWKQGFTSQFHLISSDVLATITKEKVYYGSELFLSVADSKLGALAKRI